MQLFELEEPVTLEDIWTGDRSERKEVDGVTYKWCMYHDHWVDVKCFGSDIVRSDGLSYWCKSCSKEATLEYRAIRKFKLPLLHEQGYKCRLCEKDLSKLSGHHIMIDHKKGITDRVRGVLCQACNTGLGNFNDNPELIRKASLYADTEPSITMDNLQTEGRML